MNRDAHDYHLRLGIMVISVIQLGAFAKTATQRYLGLVCSTDLNKCLIFNSIQYSYWILIDQIVSLS
jgi:hypothetical protein